MTNYTYKDILFSLRKEYIKNEEKLKKLREDSVCYNEKIKDFYFSVNKWSEDIKPEIVCEIERKQNFIKQCIEKLIFNLTGSYPNTYFKLLKNNNDEYFLNDNSIHVRPKKNKKSEFHNNINDILTSDFANLMYSTPIVANSTQSTCEYFYLSPSMISLTLSDISSGEYELSYLNYISHDDSIRISTYDHKLNEKFLYYMFELKFKKEDLSPYLQNILESSDTFDKQIICPDRLEQTTYQTKFKIEEDGKKLILRKN